MSDVIKQRLQALREAAESLDASQFQALSSGIGIGVLQRPQDPSPAASTGAQRSSAAGAAPSRVPSQPLLSPSSKISGQRSRSGFRVTKAALRLILVGADAMLFVIALGLALGLAGLAAKAVSQTSLVDMVMMLATVSLPMMAVAIAGLLLVYFLSFWLFCGGTPISLWARSRQRPRGAEGITRESQAG